MKINKERKIIIDSALDKVKECEKGILKSCGVLTALTYDKETLAEIEQIRQLSSKVNQTILAYYGKAKRDLDKV